MPAEVNHAHAVAHFNRARVITYAGGDDYYVCGSVVITPHFTFVTGHGNESTGHEVVVSIAIPKDDIRLIIDHSVNPCTVHDEMDAEAKAQMELQHAEESPKD